jgi:hypothetical protein
MTIAQKGRLGFRGKRDVSEAEGTWKKRQRIALGAMLIVIALFLFCLFYFGSRV